MDEQNPNGCAVVTEPATGEIDVGRELATVAERPAQKPAQDLRSAMMGLPAEVQTQLLTEYAERRNNFRHWLRSQFEEGVHFGFPPGCEPKPSNPKQWQPKPSLYAAGADLLCDLLSLRCEFAADVDAWTQLGSQAGHFVMACRLFSRSNGELVGEGRGVRKVGQKGGDANNAIKMAQKCAKVDAVLNCYGLRDLYSQDLEVDVQPPHDNPQPQSGVPVEQPRGKRQQKTLAVTKEQCSELCAAWRARNPNKNGSVTDWNAEFGQWVQEASGRAFDPFKAANWTEADYIACDAALTME